MVVIGSDRISALKPSPTGDRGAEPSDFGDGWLLVRPGPVPGQRSLAGRSGPTVRPGGSRVTAEQRLVQRAGFGFTHAELGRARSLGYHAYLEEQLAPEAIDDSELEEAVARQFPALGRTPAELFTELQNAAEQVVVQLIFATLYRAVYSRRPLQERMVAFWSDHFNVDIYDDDSWYLLPIQDRDVVRPHALGRFPELLSAVARSPALLRYLTNTTNRAGQTNDNFARELLELHSLGLDGGFTEEDVREVARCFTGWSVYPVEAGELAGQFRFVDADHDQGPKRVLGHDLPSGGGLEDGEIVLKILAGHPATARHLATKLAMSFWGEGPPAGLVQEVADRYEQSGGDLRAMMRALLQRPNLEEAPPRFKRPVELMVSLLRLLDVESFNPFFVLGALIDAGQLPFAWPRPDGYPVERSYWSGALLPRWRFAAGLVDEKVSGARLDLSGLAPDLPPRQLTARLDALVANGTLGTYSRRHLLAYLAGAPPSVERVRRALALALAAPELQED